MENVDMKRTTMLIKSIIGPPSLSKKFLRSNSLVGSDPLDRKASLDQQRASKHQFASTSTQKEATRNDLASKKEDSTIDQFRYTLKSRRPDKKKKLSLIMLEKRSKIPNKDLNQTASVLPPVVANSNPEAAAKKDNLSRTSDHFLVFSLRKHLQKDGLDASKLVNNDTEFNEKTYNSEQELDNTELPARKVTQAKLKSILYNAHTIQDANAIKKCSNSWADLNPKLKNYSLMSRKHTVPSLGQTTFPTSLTINGKTSSNILDTWSLKVWSPRDHSMSMVRSIGLNTIH